MVAGTDSRSHFSPPTVSAHSRHGEGADGRDGGGMKRDTREGEEKKIKPERQQNEIRFSHRRWGEWWGRSRRPVSVEPWCEKRTSARISATADSKWKMLFFQRYCVCKRLSTISSIWIRSPFIYAWIKVFIWFLSKLCHIKNHLFDKKQAKASLQSA